MTCVVAVVQVMPDDDIDYMFALYWFDFILGASSHLAGYSMAVAGFHHFVLKMWILYSTIQHINKCSLNFWMLDVEEEGFSTAIN